MNKNFGSFGRAILFYIILILIVISAILIWYIAIIAYILVIILAYIFKQYEHEKFIWGHDNTTGIFLGFVLVFGIFLIELIFGWIKINGLHPQATSILLSGLILEILVAMGEETSFRGYILPNIEKDIGLQGAIVLSSIMFSFIHLPSMILLDISLLNALIMFTTIMLAGVLVAICYLYNGLKMAIGFHFAWNFFQYHVFSLREDFGILDLSVARSIITGGNTGPEAGVLGLIMMLIGLEVITWWRNK